MGLFADYCFDLGFRPNDDELLQAEDNSYDNEIRKDTTDFTVVDGEEGDYGNYKYYSPNNSLLAIWICQGGDVYWYEFTKAGHDYFAPAVLRLIENQLKRFKEKHSTEG